MTRRTVYVLRGICLPVLAASVMLDGMSAYSIISTSLSYRAGELTLLVVGRDLRWYVRVESFDANTNDAYFSFKVLRDRQPTAADNSWFKLTTTPWCPERSPGTGTTTWLEAIVPLASMPLVLINAALWLPSLRRRALAARCEEEPQCENCGYSLRGNESGICPECGTERR